MFRGLVPVLVSLLALAAAPASAQTPAQGPPPAPAPQPAPAPAAQADEAPAFKISGLVFGDYYYVAANHRDELEGQNGFWLRRVYFTYDQTLSKAFSMRFRLELNSKGDFKSTGVNTPYLKDAWLKWTRGAHALVFGMAPTPQIDFVDGFQGYRSIEKPPIDLYRWDSSRDLGLVLQGRFGKAQRTSYALQLGNGSGTGSEVDQSKSVRAQLAHRFAGGLVLEGYADWQDRPDGRDVSTLEAFAGWQEPKWRASLQYGQQKRREAGSRRPRPGPRVPVRVRPGPAHPEGHRRRPARPQLRSGPERRDDRLHAVLRDGAALSSATRGGRDACKDRASDPQPRMDHLRPEPRTARRRPPTSSHA